MCSVTQIDVHGNSYDKTSVHRLNLSTGRMTFLMSAFNEEDIGSVYTIAINCNDFKTEFSLAVQQDCTHNELFWKTTFDQILFNSAETTEATYNFDYGQTIPGCAVTCKYIPEYCIGEQFCHMQDFSSCKKEFKIVRTSSQYEQHDSIVCTSEQNKKEITNNFVVRQEPIQVGTCEGVSDAQMVHGSASHTHDFAYNLDGKPRDLELFVQHAKPGCGLDCAVD